MDQRGDRPDLEATQRMGTPRPDVRTRAGAGFAPIGALAFVALVIVGAILLRPGTGDPAVALATDSPTSVADTAPTPNIASSPAGPTGTLQPTPIQPATEEPTVAPPDPTAAPERTPRPTKPAKTPQPKPETFSATVTAGAQCSNDQGLEVVGVQAAFASPQEIRRVVFFLDGAQISSVDFDAGAYEAAAATGATVTPGEPHEATADFYTDGDMLVAGQVSSGAFTVELTASCGS